jgi:hypothetical protein
VSSASTSRARGAPIACPPDLSSRGTRAFRRPGRHRPRRPGHLTARLAPTNAGAMLTRCAV